MLPYGIDAAPLLAGVCAAAGWLTYRRLAKRRRRLLRELFAAAAAAGVCGDPATLLVIQASRSSEPELGRLIAAAPRSWPVVLAGPGWLAELKSAAWGRPVGLMSGLSPSGGALRDGTYAAIRRGGRFELVHELLPYMQRLGRDWPQVGDESPSADADEAAGRLLQ